MARDDRRELLHRITSFAAAGGPLPRVEESSRLTLLLRLSEMLKREGFGKLCSRQRPGTAMIDPRSSWPGFVYTVVLSVVYASFAVERHYGEYRLGRVAISTLAVFILIVVIGVLLESRIPALSKRYATVLQVGFIATLGYQLAAADLGSLERTHLVPIGLGLVLFVLPALRRLRLPSPSYLLRTASVLAAAPWLVPITLLIVVVPLFSEDLWRLAGQANAVRVVELASVTVLPMLGLVLWYLLINRFDQIINEASGELRIDGPVGDQTEKAIADLLEEIELTENSRTGRGGYLKRLWRQGRNDFTRFWRQMRGAQPRSKRPASERELLRESFGSSRFDHYVRYARARLDRTFRAQIVSRVILLVFGIALGSAAYIYMIAWIVIPAKQAESWTGRSEPSTWETPLGFAVTTGPHLLVAAMTGVIATAVFLALVITTNEMEQAFQRAATHGPLRRCLSVAVPFARLAGDHELNPHETLRSASGTRVVGATAPLKADVETPGRVCVWFEWTSLADGHVSMDTEESKVDTALAVYTRNGPRLTAVKFAVGEGQHRVGFDAVRGTTYEIAVDGFAPHGDLNEDDIKFRWLTNDVFDAAEEIDGLTGTRRGHNRGATREEGEPQHAGLPGGVSVWYRWRAPSSRQVTLNTDGSNFATLLAAYTGTELGNLQVVASEGLEHPGRTSRVTFRAQAGTEYRIAVDGWNGDTGDVVVNWGPPPNDDLHQAQGILGAAGAFTGHNVTATKEDGEPDHAGRPGGASVWFRWTAPEGGKVTFDTVGSTFDTLLAVYTGTTMGDLEEVASNDDIAPYKLQSRLDFTATKNVAYLIAVDGFEAAIGELTLNWYYQPVNNTVATALPLGARAEGHNRGASKERDEPDHAHRPGGASVWYRWTAPVEGDVTFDTVGSTFDTLLAVYTGTGIDDLEEVASNDDAAGLGTLSRVRIHVERDAEYLVVIDGYAGATGDFVLNWRYPPMHSELSQALRIEGRAGTRHDHNFGATKERQEPNHAGSAGGASVWYRWTAPVAGEAVFDTDGSTFDTLLGVYKGPTVDRLETVAANDDAEGLGFLSRVRFPVAAQDEYLIAVDGFGGECGNVVLNWELIGAPGNDRFESAEEIHGPTGTRPGHNRGTTPESGEPDHAGRSGGASIWYRWTAPSDGEASFDTGGSTFDTLLAVYTGDTVEELDEVASNDDAFDLGFASRVEFRASEGVTYAIAVDGFGASTGDVTLNWEFVPTPPGGEKPKP